MAGRNNHQKIVAEGRTEKRVTRMAQPKTLEDLPEFDRKAILYMMSEFPDRDDQQKYDKKLNDYVQSMVKKDSITYGKMARAALCCYKASLSAAEQNYQEVAQQESVGIGR